VAGNNLRLLLFPADTDRLLSKQIKAETSCQKLITVSHEKKISITEFNLYLYKRPNNEDTLTINKHRRGKVNIFAGKAVL